MNHYSKNFKHVKKLVFCRQLQYSWYAQWELEFQKATKNNNQLNLVSNLKSLGGLLVSNSKGLNLES